MLVRWLEIGAVMLSLWLAAFLYTGWAASRAPEVARDAMLRADAVFLGQAGLALLLAWLLFGLVGWFMGRGRRA